MAKTQITILEIFIASPGDVSPEREVLESVVSEFNRTWGDKHQVRLEIFKWETHSYPAIGKDAQDVINHQIGDNYDIFIGIMWGRFGSATARAGSGTEEEFQRAYKRLKNGEEVQIMFYFKDAGIPPSKLDMGQISKVLSFKSKIANEYGGLYHQFGSTDDFHTKARIHLSYVVQDWLDANSGVIESKSLAKIEEVETDEYNPLANLSALETNGAEEDVFELVDRGTSAMDELGEILKKMTVAIIDLGGKFRQRTTEVSTITSKGSYRTSVKQIANNVA
ncbi:MAG: DUF4062 domain-containing protein, partial [Cyanobacteria bacterium J06649_11]